MSQALRISTQNRVATVVLSRPEVRNAFNDEVIAELSHAFTQLGEDPAVLAPGWRAAIARGRAAARLPVPALPHPSLARN